tara:strand:+ start:1089 stop:2072 length:984 start_codon:yes stop_codon:yes gene_type:complete
MKKKVVPIVLKELKSVIVPEVQYGLQKIISYSQLNIFSSCPHRWGLNYRDGHKVYLPSIHAVFGTAVHTTIQEYLTAFYDESVAAADRLDLNAILKESLRVEYLATYKKNKNTHFSNPSELAEFYDDGVNIIKYIKSNKAKYFSKKGWHLAGIEMPLNLQPNSNLQNVRFVGYLDIVLYHEGTNTIKIIDIKTSTRGWGDKDKKDEMKQTQLILYKKLFADQYNFPVDNIEIEFFITRRKIFEEGDYPQKRIQEFIPASGKTKMNKAGQLLGEFLTEAFNNDGGYKPTDFEKRPSKHNCNFCPYKDNSNLCDKNEKPTPTFAFFKPS